MDDSAVNSVATEENQVLWEYSESESWSVHEDDVTGKLVASSVKPEAHDPLESMEIPTDSPVADPRTDEQRRRNLLQEYEQQFEQLSHDQKLSKLCSNAGLKTVERRQYFITLDAERPSGMVH